MRTIKTDKLIHQFEHVCWALGYWQRRIELSTSLEKTQYCMQGLQRNEKLLPGILEVMALIKMPIDERAGIKKREFNRGVQAANSEQENIVQAA